MADNKIATQPIFFGNTLGYAEGSEVAADVVERFKLDDLVRPMDAAEKKAAKARADVADVNPHAEPQAATPKQEGK